MSSPEESTELLRVEKLYCERSWRELFGGMDVSVTSGHITQVCGENGAGKTTLLRILAGLGSDFEGEVKFFLPDDRYAPDELLFIGHLPGLKAELTAFENLQWITSINRCSVTRGDIVDALGKMGLGEKTDIALRELSAGQKRRVVLARLLLEDKMLWFLDEPFTSLDVTGIALLESLFREHVAGGGAIVLATHQELGSGLEPKRIFLGAGSDE